MQRLQAYLHSLLILSNNMKLGTIDYNSSYFKHKTPTPIRGSPAHKLLKRLKKESQANTSSIETNLGGGNHGYLRLALIDEEHDSIYNAQLFAAPTHPLPFDTPATSTSIQALQSKENHAETNSAYVECENIEKAILRNVQDVLEEKHIEALVDQHTNLLTDDVPTVLE